jgi:hypothetical protein
MSKRPLVITMIAGLFLAIGAAGILRPLADGGLHSRFHDGELWIFLLAFVAVICGVFLLLRQNWARWLTLAWMAAHVGISFLNSFQEVAAHALILSLIAYFVFRAESNAWFRPSKTDIE